MAALSAGTFTALGLDASRTIAALEGVPEAMRKVLETRHPREGYRNLAASTLAVLWHTKAMPFDETKRVKRVMKLDA